MLHISLKESSTITQSDCLNRNYIKPVGMMSQTTKVRMMHTITSYTSLEVRACVLCDKYFPKQNIRLHKKDLQSPWITTGIKKSSKREQKLYVEFLKNRNNKNELEYKIYEKLFESIKKRGKENYFSSLIFKPKNNIKKPGMLLKKQYGKRDVITKFTQKKSY